VERFRRLIGVNMAQEMTRSPSNALYPAAAFTALQATWEPPPLPELDQILARVLSDRFRLPSRTAAA
jgi:hypothetical protein